MGVIKSRYNDMTFFCHNDKMLQNTSYCLIKKYFWKKTEWFQNSIRNKFSIPKEETQALRYLSLNIVQKNI